MLMRYGRRISSPLFQLVVRPNTLPYSRFVLIAGRTVDKRAVVRNRLCRRVREYIMVYGIKMLDHRDIAVIIKKESVAARRNDFYDDLKHILARVR